MKFLDGLTAWFDERNESTQKKLIKAMPGMRIIKTMIAIIVSLAISHILNFGSPVNIAVISVFSMQKTSKETVKSGFNRIRGILISGVYTFFTLLLLKDIINLSYASNWYFISTLFFMFWLMILVTYTGNGDSFGYAVMVYLATMFGFDSFNPVSAVLMRVAEAVIALTITIIINSNSKLNQAGEKLQKIKER